MRMVLILALLVSTPVAGAQQRALQLLSEAVVQRDTVWLSDLLPVESSLPLRAAAEKISLGRAPEVGSFRVFTRAQLRAETAGNAEIGFPDQVVVRRQGWNLDPEDVRQALAGSAVAKTFDFSQAKISFPREVMTGLAAPRLDVVRFVRSSGRSFTAALACRERRACGVFLAEITQPPSSAPTRLETHHQIPRRKIVAPTPDSRILVWPGTPATLVVDADAVRIKLRVLPFRRAALGETVRVVDPVTHHLFMAEVTGEGQLRLSTDSNHIEAKR